MMRFKRWLSFSSFSRGFLEESLGNAIVSVSSRAPISLKFLKPDLAELDGSAIEEVSGAASAVTIGGDMVCTCLAGFALSADLAELDGSAIEEVSGAASAVAIGGDMVCTCLAGLAFSATTTEGKKS
jgi:hypothetical protein